MISTRRRTKLSFDQVEEKNDIDEYPRKLISSNKFVSSSPNYPPSSDEEKQLTIGNTRLPFARLPSYGNNRRESLFLPQ
jgi:hypothetical protein